MARSGKGRLAVQCFRSIPHLLMPVVSDYSGLKGSIHCRYSDYVRTESGLQFQDLREGTGKAAKSGSQVTVDWDGYTIGMQSLIRGNSSQMISCQPAACVFPAEVCSHSLRVCRVLRKAF